MSADEIVRRWKEHEGEDNPAGCMDMTDEELQEVRGQGRPTNWAGCTRYHTCAANLFTLGACCTITIRPRCH